MHSNLLIYHALSFVAVVDAGSFSKAAKNCGVSKAQLSRHVCTLEKLLGIQLMHRTTRVMKLTKEGKEFFISCKKIQDASFEAINGLKKNSDQMSGILRVTAPIDFGIQFLPSIVKEFSLIYPNMNVVVSLSNTNENVIEKDYDIAIRIANELPNSNLRQRVLSKFKRIICASPKYLKKFGKPTSLNELMMHQCITSVNHDNSLLYPRWSFIVNRKPINYKLERYIELDSLLAQQELVMSAMGIGRFPEYMVKKKIKSGELIELFEKIEKPISYVYILYPDTIALPKKTRAFIDLVIKSMHI